MATADSIKKVWAWRVFGVEIFMDFSSGICLLQSGHVEMDLFPGSLPSPFWSSHTPGQKLTWNQIVRTLQKLRRNPPSMAVVNYREEAFFRTGTGWASGIGSATRAAFFRPSRLGELLFFAFLTRNNIPIALLNRSDVGEIPAGSDWYYRRCHACFVRELNPQPEMSLKNLFSLSGGNPQSNRRARRILGLFDPSCPIGRVTSKLHPISLGTPDESIHEIPHGQPKEWDLFFAGDLHEKGLRGRLLEEVKNWAGRAGRKVLLRERLPRSEYLRCMATSRLALSPPGMGWDCWRHYEAKMAGSVPLMPYPTILQHRPGIDGEHCFYFAPEPEGLTRCLEKTLAVPESLPAMAATGRQLVLEHHLFSKLRDYVIHETFKAFSRASH